MSSPDVIAKRCDCTGPCRCGDVALAVNPFVSNRYHFGMLLGVADLEAEQAYHRGKSWLHNAWLHGIGVVWGLGVEVRADRNEVVVHRGLAIDCRGRELYVAHDMCVDLGRWFAERRPDDLEVVDRPDGGLTFFVHVELCHDTCLDRPVPSISEPCEDSTFDTAYSRAVERGLPRLVGGPAPDEPVSWYPRLRQFFGQLPVTDDLVTDARAAVEAANPADRAAICLGWFRRLAAADTLELQPEEGAAGWSPVAGDGCVPLADLFVHLRPDSDGFTVVADGDAPTAWDNLVRPAHVRTRTIQELLCRSPGPAPAVPPSGSPLVEAAAAGGAAAVGPQLVAGSAEVVGRDITAAFTSPIDSRTVGPAAFTVSALRADGWHALEVRRATLDDAGTGVTLTLAGAPRARPLLVVAHGAGPSPLLGVNGRPLAGVAGTPPGDGTGHDAALMVIEPPDDGEEPQ